MAKSFNEAQFRDPWLWCMEVIAKHELTSKQVAELTDSPSSTVRALLAGRNAAPRYEQLCKIIMLCIAYESTGEAPVPPVKAVEDFDFL